jgi:hypothetical protein
MTDMERPKSITVFGVLNIILGALGLLNGLCGIVAQGVLESLRREPNFRNPLLDQMEQVPFLKAWTIIGLGLGLITSAVLLAAGIGLLQRKRWGRLLSVGYSLCGLIWSALGSVVNVVYIWRPILSQLDQTQGPERLGAIASVILGAIGILFVIVYCVLLLYFMTRPRVVAAFDPNFDVTQFAKHAEAGLAPYGAPGGGAAPSTPYSPPATSSYSAEPSSGSGEETVATIIPYRNAPALIAYYLGVFSLAACIPFIGIIGIGMAIAAFICGLKGLRHATQHPEAHGRVHAWIGIIGGALCTILGLIINVLVIIAIVASGKR